MADTLPFRCVLTECVLGALVGGVTCGQPCRFSHVRGRDGRYPSRGTRIVWVARVRSFGNPRHAVAPNRIAYPMPWRKLLIDNMLRLAVADLLPHFARSIAFCGIFDPHPPETAIRI